MYARTDLHSAGAVPGALAAVEQLPAGVRRGRAARQRAAAGPRAGPRRAGRAAPAAAAAVGRHARLARGAAGAAAAAAHRARSVLPRPAARQLPTLDFLLEATQPCTSLRDVTPVSRECIIVF